MQLCGSLNILWPSVSLGLEWKLTISSPVATAEFSKFAGILNAALSQHHLSRFWNSSTGIPSPPLALFLVMLPKDHLTLHSRMSVFRWVITPWWLSGSWSSFLYSSVCFCHFFLISSASVRSIPFLSFFVSIFARKSTWSHGGVTDVKIERKRTEIGILSYHCLAYILQCGVYYTFLCTN